jgi:hypothetical protein
MMISHPEHYAHKSQKLRVIANGTPISLYTSNIGSLGNIFIRIM